HRGDTRSAEPVLRHRTAACRHHLRGGDHRDPGRLHERYRCGDGGRQPFGAAMAEFLEVEGASKTFGGVRAVDGMDIKLAEGQICGLIGPNGSGKTTLLGLLSGTYRPDRGTIKLRGQRLDGLSTHRTVQQGVARTFQTSRLFFRWTLAANLAAATAARPLADDNSKATTADPEHVLALVGLAGRGDTICASLSNAEQRLAMIAVALATRPVL